MKVIISTFLSLALFCVACSGSSKKEKEVKLDFGKLEGKKYSNDYFNFSIELPDPWIYDTTQKIKSTYFGGNLLDAEFHDPEYDSVLTVTCVISADKINPFKSDVSEESEFKETNKAIGILYDDDELLISEFEKHKIGKVTFTRNQVVILESETDSLYTDEYSYLKGDYLLSIAFSYRTKTDEKQVQEALKQIVFH